MRACDNLAFDDHEQVEFRTDSESGLRSIIALHSTSLGPAAGGCRAWHYATDSDAMTDVLRLSRGMSYKNAMAGLPLGGGKAVILLSPGGELTDSLLWHFGGFVDSLAGRYITAEDVGLSVAAMQVVAQSTDFVAGLPPKKGAAGGDPSPKTAYGVYRGILAAVTETTGRETLEGITVAVQGVGHVGYPLCGYLSRAGCRIVVADTDGVRERRACVDYGATVVPLDEILYQDVDVLAPCAMGAAINSESVGGIQARIVAGAANNQLATDVDGESLYAAGILYCPDYVINAGGIINVAREYEGCVDDAEVHRQIESIGPRLQEIFALSREQGRPTNVVADEFARRIIGSAAHGSQGC